MKTLIGVDFSDSSKAAAQWVARWFAPESPLALAYAIRLPTGPSFTRVRDQGHDEIVEQAKTEARAALTPLAEESGAGRTEVLVGTGSPAEALLGLADGWSAEVIAVGPHGHSPLLTGFFGSTASRLLRRSPMPVLVVRNEDPHPPRRILVALDDRHGTRSIVETARALHGEHGCDVRGFYAFETLLEGLPVFSGPSGSIDLETGLRDTAEAWLEELLVNAGVPADDVETDVGTGRAGPAICEAADGADLIVMGTHGDPLGGGSLGSVARYVVAHAQCPVLVVPARES